MSTVPVITDVNAFITRTNLGLPNLNLDDGAVYVLAAPFNEDSTISWRRQQAKSPFVESQFTVNRVRDIVQTSVAVDVLATDQVTLASRVQTLIQAFTQDTYSLIIQMDAQTYQWSCECADYAMNWTRERMLGMRTQVVFTVYRSPVPTIGPI